MSHVILKNLTKIFDDKVVVDDVNLNIDNGEFLVIVGPSGCGKTTILRMIAGLEKPSSGEIVIGEEVVNDIHPKDRDISMVFQNHALYPHMTVFNNIAFHLKLLRYQKSEIKKRAIEASRLLEIEYLLERKPGTLSGGQRQRVAVARAIVRKPRAFLFDEPLSNLDARMRLTARAELKSLHHRLNATMIYVTHDQAEAMTLADRVCVIYDGKVQQIGSPMDVYNKPANKFVAAFLGTPPMNLIDGLINFKQERPEFVTEDFAIAIPAKLESKLSSFQQMKMTLGIRPEHIYMKPTNEESQNHISATIDVIEPFGNRMDLYLNTQSGQRLISSVAPDEHINSNCQVKLYFDSNNIHIFETEGIGKNLILNRL